MRFNGTGGRYYRGDQYAAYTDINGNIEVNQRYPFNDLANFGSPYQGPSDWRLCDQDYPTGQNASNNQPIYGFEMGWHGNTTNISARPSYWMMDFGMSAPRHGSDGVSGLTSGNFIDAVDIVFEKLPIWMSDNSRGTVTRTYVPIYVPAKGIPVFRLYNPEDDVQFGRWFDFYSKGDSVAQTLATSIELLGGFDSSDQTSDTTITVSGLATNTWSSWVQVGRLNYRSKYISHSVFPNSGNDSSVFEVQVAYGEAGDEIQIYQAGHRSNGQGTYGSNTVPFPCSLPAGTAISIRVQTGLSVTNAKGVYIHNYY